MAIVLPDARELSDEVLEALRIRVLRGRELGLSEAELAETFGIARETVSRWWSAFCKGGLETIPHERTGRPKGSGRILSDEQAFQIQTILNEQLPREQEINSPLWTRRAVRDLIQKLYAIDMPVRTVGEYLKRWGYSPKQPRRRARDQDPEEVREWLEKIYPAIEEFAAQEDAEILWSDETGIDSNTHVGRGYALIGEPAIIEVSASPCRLNVISTISNEGDMRFMTYTETLTWSVFLRFLGKLIAGANRKIYLIVDRHTVHESAIVEKWLREHEDKITMFYLPRRAPERNPVEYLNQDLKAGVNDEKLPVDKKELLSNVQSFLHRLSKLTERVRSYFRSPFTQYGAATM